MSADDRGPDDAHREASRPPPPPRQPPPPPPPVITTVYQRANTYGLGILLQLLIAMVIGATLFFMFAIWQDIQLIDDFEAGRDLTLTEIEAVDDRISLASVLSLLSLVPALVLYLIWIFRSYQTLHRERADQSREPPVFSPGGAVGWHFVPIVNLAQIPRIVNALYDSTSPLSLKPSSESPRGWSRPGVWPQVVWWWGLSIASRLLDIFASPSADSSLSTFRVADYVSLVSDAIWIVSGVLLIMIVRRVTTHQNVGPSPGPIDEPPLFR